jgi:Flp pilus assembly pilin Flp
MDLRDWYQLLRAAATREEGQTMAEYGVVLALITLGIITALGALGLAISGKLGDVKNVLTSALPIS